MRAQLSVPDALKTLGRTTTFTSTDNAQIGAASEAMLDPSICSMGPDNAIWISDDLMSASRIGLKDLHIGVEKELSNVRAQIAAPTAVGLRGIAKLSTAEVHSEAASFSPAEFHIPGRIRPRKQTLSILMVMDFRISLLMEKSILPDLVDIFGVAQIVRGTGMRRRATAMQCLALTSYEIHTQTHMAEASASDRRRIRIQRIPTEDAATREAVLAA